MFDISKIEIITLLKKLYDTIHMLNYFFIVVKNIKIEIDSKYQDYFIVENYRGNQNIKYKQNVLDLIGINSIFGVGNK